MSTKYLTSFLDTLQNGSYLSSVAEQYASFQSTKDVQAEELKQILLDAKEGLEVKNTTHEFYETLERITNELRGMTEHSTAFLSRVRKSDAPDYFNIIKNPMDLGTVLKKVKAQQYKDKRMFKADLDLIWDNCLLYNTLPNHPLRKSAMILRNRANHLLEFVTDPVATTPAPPVVHSQSASRFDRPGSRLDALDASHVVISTANILGTPKGGFSVDVSKASPASYSNGIAETRMKTEDADGNSVFEEDFQDAEEDEEDESIRTRKGLTSHKTQPGGGRNLDLLRGLAATDPSADAIMTGDEFMSIYPSGIEEDSAGSTKPSPSPAARSSTTPTPVSTPAVTQTASGLLPDAPGTVPGQGSALLARRATAATHGSRDRRMKHRTPSMPPSPSHIPFEKRPALTRTPEAMLRFMDLDQASQTSSTASGDLYKQIIGGSNGLTDQTALSTLITSALDDGFSGTGQGDQAGPSNLSRLALNASSSSDRECDQSWWQAVCSNAMLSNVIPAIPAVSCKRTRNSRQVRSSTPVVNKRAKNTVLESISHLKHVKRAHRKLAVLRRDGSDLQGETTVESDEATDEEKAESQVRSAPVRRLEETLALGDTSSRHAQRLMQHFCATMLEYAGFDSVQKSALESISSLAVQHITSLGQAAAFHRDMHARRRPIGTILKKALHEVSTIDTGPSPQSSLTSLARYKGVDLPERSQQLEALRTSLEDAYAQELEEAEGHVPKFHLDIDDPSLVMPFEDLDGDIEDSDPQSSYALLRALLESEDDHLALEHMNIPSDTKFPMHLLHASYLRQTFPSQSSELKRPFDAPPPFVPIQPLTSQHSGSKAVKSGIGLLQPFMQARMESPFALYDDSDLPAAVSAEVKKALATRPEVPVSTGRIVLGKRKRDTGVTATAPPPVAVASVVNSTTAPALGGPAKTIGDKLKKGAKAPAPA